MLLKPQWEDTILLLQMLQLLSFSFSLKVPLPSSLSLLAIVLLGTLTLLLSLTTTGKWRLFLHWKVLSRIFSLLPAHLSSNGKAWALRLLMVIWITKKQIPGRLSTQGLIEGKTWEETPVVNWKYSAGLVARRRKGVGSALDFSVVPATLAFVFSPQHSDFCLFSMVSAAHFPFDMIKTFYQKQCRGRSGLFGLNLISSLTSRETKAKVEEQWCVPPCLSQAHI